MQEIGMWTTSEGTVSAVLEFDSELADDADGQELPKWASGALSGALGGAATGAAAGPWGALIGAAAGATIGGVAAATQPKQPAQPAQTTMPVGKPAPPQPGGTPQGTQAVSQRDNAILALQQFAAAVPALVQLVASGGPAKSGAKPESTGESLSAQEGFEAYEWASYSADEGAWTVP